MQNVFASQEARLEFQMELRKEVIQEMLQYEEMEGEKMADVLSNLLFGIDAVFSKYQ